MFSPVGTKRNYSPGNILYHQEEFYVVVPKKKLKPISWAHAGKQIYASVGGIGNQANYRISKQKILFSFQINEEEQIQTCVKPRTFPFKGQSIPGEPRFEQSLPPRELADRRAKALLRSIVRDDRRFQIQCNRIYIKSINKKTYYIELQTGEAYLSGFYRICVMVEHGEMLPLYDKIIAKALTIAYAPCLIRTL